jgi:hypothetical protein
MLSVCWVFSALQRDPVPKIGISQLVFLKAAGYDDGWECHSEPAGSHFTADF